MNLPPGIRSEVVSTDRLRMRYLDSGPEDGIPVVMIHGNLSTGRFYEHLMPGAPERYRVIAPDMRVRRYRESTHRCHPRRAGLDRRHLLVGTCAWDHPA